MNDFDPASNEIPPDIFEDLMEDGEIEDIDDSKPWKVDTPERASWAARKLSYWQSRIDEVKKVADSERAHIKVWEENTTAGFQRQIDFFEGQLISFHRAEYARDPKRKTLTFPGGEVKRTEGTYSVGLIENEAKAFFEWAMENADTLVRVPDPKPEVNKLEIKKAIKDKKLVEQNGHVYQDGEEIPGITYTRPDPTFKVIPKPKEEVDS